MMSTLSTDSNDELHVASQSNPLAASRGSFKINPSSAPGPPSRKPNPSPVSHNPMLQPMSESRSVSRTVSIEDQESQNESLLHENEKTNHYSKLGSAFLSSNGLLSSRGGRGGRGRGIK
jgi:hypothetical protein